VLFRSHAPFSEGAGPEPEIWVPVPRTPFVGQASCANDTVVVSLNGPSDSGTGAANVQKLELEPKTSDARSRCLKLVLAPRPWFRQLLRCRGCWSRNVPKHCFHCNKLLQAPVAYSTLKSRLRQKLGANWRQHIRP